MMCCPNHPEHKLFVTGAAVYQLWIVDQNGEWIETLDDSVGVYARPNTENIWECLECGAEAVPYELRLVENKDE